MLLVNVIGGTALFCFSARQLAQWVLSERAHRVVSPNIYWIFSLLGCYLYFAYGWLRSDFAILAGQLVSVYVYIWNLKVKGLWIHIPRLMRLVLQLVPIAALLTLVLHFSEFSAQFLRNPDNPLWLLLIGTSGNLIFSSRFLFQWYYSYRHHESILPAGFWMIALTGSILIIIYGILRADWVQVLGQFSIVISIRNLMLIFRDKHRKTP